MRIHASRLLITVAVLSGCASRPHARLQTEIGELQRKTCVAGGPVESSSLHVQTWQVSMSWSCAWPPAWDAYAADLERDLKPYQRKATSPLQVVFARSEPGDYYLVTITAAPGTPGRIVIRFVAGPD
jgi:hypothetical protein